jgi:hypothetical protein
VVSRQRHHRGFNFGMSLCGAISATLRTVGANGLGLPAGVARRRFRCVSVVGKAFILAMPLSGGRVGDCSATRA